jgi:hypothetical protein
MMFIRDLGTSNVTGQDLKQGSQIHYQASARAGNIYGDTSPIMWANFNK